MPRKAKNRDGIYRRPDRPGEFWGSWTDANGRRRRRKLNAHTLEQAKTLLFAEKVAADKTRTLGYAPPTKDTFENVSTRYLKHQKARVTERSYQRESGIMRTHLLPFFGTIKLADLRRADVQKYVTQRSAEASAASVVKEVNIIKHLLKLAVDWQVIQANCAQGIKCPKVAAGRVRYLQPTELRAVLAACPEWLRPIAGLAVATGMRRGEILSLRWLDIDPRGGRIMLPQTKNGDGRIVYLNSLAQEVLESMRSPEAKPTDRVFNDSRMIPDYVSQIFAAACLEVGILDFSFHDLRHTAASWMRMRGADIHTVAQVLGHKDLRMAARYQHLSPAFLSDAVKLLDSAFAEPKKLPKKRAQNGNLSSLHRHQTVHN